MAEYLFFLKTHLETLTSFLGLVSLGFYLVLLYMWTPAGTHMRRSVSQFILCMSHF